MPLIRRKPLSFTIDTEEGKQVIIDVPYEGAKDPTTPAYWDQLIYSHSYQAALEQLSSIS
jgi:selenophosphate synthetase-related protein